MGIRWSGERTEMMTCWKVDLKVWWLTAVKQGRRSSDSGLLILCQSYVNPNWWSTLLVHLEYRPRYRKWWCLDLLVHLGTDLGTDAFRPNVSLVNKVLPPCLTQQRRLLLLQRLRLLHYQSITTSSPEDWETYRRASSHIHWTRSKCGNSCPVNCLQLLKVKVSVHWSGRHPTSYPKRVS